MTINCKGQLIDLSIPKVMGILNITPDSFYDGGKYKNDKDILNQAEKMLNDGATFIDVGAYSSRPNSQHITEAEELNRIIPIVEILSKTFPNILLSIDTFRSRVAKEGIQSGACMINDISAGKLDQDMIQTVADLNVPYVMMHMRGNPQTMQNYNTYEHLIKDILFYFSERIATARSCRIVNLIIDPGFGFAKTITQNFELLKHLNHFKRMDLPILVGVSRKSMIYKSLDITANDALNGTTVLNTIALQNGADILRVHDVKEAMDCVKLYNLIY